MTKSDEERVYEYVRDLGRPVSIPTIREELDIRGRNQIEQAVLKNLRSGRVAMTSKGVEARAEV